MIATENQLRVSKDRLSRFLAHLADLQKSGGSDVIGQAQLRAVQDQVQRLEGEIEEYESLRSGEIQSFEVHTLLDLPTALIKARIARSLTQTALAELIGVKPQQIQRWESEGYPKVGLDRLAQIAEALGLRISDRVELRRQKPIKASQVRDGLISAGLPSQIVKSRIIPSSLDEDEDEFMDELDARLNLIFGSTLSNISSGGLNLPASQMAFKLPKSAAQARVRIYAHYVEAICRIAAKTSPNPEVVPPTAWRDVRSFFGGKELDFYVVVNRCWDCGIPVLALRDKIAFHGACWTANGRSVLVLKQNHMDVSRWMFDLFHEYYHAANPQNEGEELLLEADETSPDRRDSPSERRAHRFSAEVITGGRLEELTTEIYSLASGQGPRLKGATMRVSERSGVPVGILANLMAHRLSESGFDWWAVASKLQVEEGDPSAIVRRVFFERASLDVLPRVEKDLLLQAMESA